MSKAIENLQAAPLSRVCRSALYSLCLASATILVSCSLAKREYGLPVTLGSTPDQVRKVLGMPTERYGPPQIGDNGAVMLSQTGDQIVEWYYPAGIVAFFDHDRLAAITLNTYTGYKGFLPYSREVAKGVTLADDKESILRRLGNPAKVRDDDLAGGTDLDTPVVWPAQSSYFWRFKDFGLQATFLKQAQSVSEEEHLTFPKDHLVSFLVESLSEFDKDVNRASKANDYLFVWNRPVQFPVGNLPIAQSATCRFKKSVGVGFQKPDAESHRPQGISYSAADENESDTVTFIDLDTRSPTVRSNGGQARLRVLFNDEQMIFLQQTASNGATEMYTIFRPEGVVIHSSQLRSPLIGPFGTIEMGYCN